jgi:hypothetical protein
MMGDSSLVGPFLIIALIFWGALLALWARWTRERT